MERTIEQAAADAVRIITQAADAAANRLALAADNAIKVVAAAAAETQKVNSIADSNDHDLLIELRAKMDRLSEDIRELKSGNNMMLTSHGRRIGDLETWKASCIGETGGRKNLWGLILAGVMALIAILVFIIPHWKP